MAREPNYGKVATTLTSGTFSTIYGVQHIFEYDVIAEIAPEVLVTGLGLSALVGGVMTWRDEITQFYNGD